MKWTICAWGKAGHGPEAEMVARYLGRIRWPVTVQELSPGQEPPQTAGRRVLLDERGENLDSVAFARRLAFWRDDGVAEVQFVIGPADGLGAARRASADLLLAFGALTWPHLLARAMLAEQLYRAATIIAGHPYHRA